MNNVGGDTILLAFSFKPYFVVVFFFFFFSFFFCINYIAYLHVLLNLIVLIT